MIIESIMLVMTTELQSVTYRLSNAGPGNAAHWEILRHSRPASESESEGAPYNSMHTK